MQNNNWNDIFENIFDAYRNHWKVSRFFKNGNRIKKSRV